MDQQRLTREDVLRTLGEDIDDAFVAEVISTGATPSELALAIDRLRNDAAVWNPRPRREPRIAALCDMLEQWWRADEEHDEYAATD